TYPRVGIVPVYIFPYGGGRYRFVDYYHRIWEPTNTRFASQAGGRNHPRPGPGGRETEAGHSNHGGPHYHRGNHDSHVAVRQARKYLCTPDADYYHLDGSYRFFG